MMPLSLSIIDAKIGKKALETSKASKRETPVYLSRCVPAYNKNFLRPDISGNKRKKKRK